VPFAGKESMTRKEATEVHAKARHGSPLPMPRVHLSSHDLRTPLQTLLTDADLLLEVCRNERMRRVVVRMERSIELISKRLHSMEDEVLANASSFGPIDPAPF